MRKLAGEGTLDDEQARAFARDDPAGFMRATIEAVNEGGPLARGTNCGGPSAMCADRSSFNLR